jgi:uncharacterized protein YcbK (DUF882 family)
MQPGRRNFLSGGFAIVGAATLGLGTSALAFPEADVRRLAFSNLHTGETLSVAYWERGAYVPDALRAVDNVLRDFRTGEVHSIEPRLLDLLVALSGKVERREPFEVISGYRSPATNAALHALTDGVATHSLHMDGRAIDIRVGGVELAQLRDAALSLSLGGVGYYPTSDFVHVDVGRVRRWSGS